MQIRKPSTSTHARNRKSQELYLSEVWRVSSRFCIARMLPLKSLATLVLPNEQYPATSSTFCGVRIALHGTLADRGRGRRGNTCSGLPLTVGMPVIFM